jgi:hypothetical protein
VNNLLDWALTFVTIAVERMMSAIIVNAKLNIFILFRIIFEASDVESVDE